MKSFWGKSESDESAKATDTATGNGVTARPEHRVTVGLARAEQLAVMLAHSRAAKFVEVADMLAGMYIYEWDRLSRFWEDRTEIEEFLRRICSISSQRWHHWIELYDKQHHQEEKESASSLQRFFIDARNRHGDSGAESPDSRHSLELDAIFESAGEISPFTDTVDGQSIPVITTECVLLCIARNPQSEISRKLRETGLDLAALERAARDPRRAPHRYT